MANFYEDNLTHIKFRNVLYQPCMYNVIIMLYKEDMIYIIILYEKQICVGI